MTKKKIKISCLPVAGIENPYQYLMIQGLRKEDGLEVGHGVDGKFFALLKTYFKDKPDFIHLDWLHQYYLRRKHWMTFLQFPLFVLEVLFIKYFSKTKLVWTLHNIRPHDQPYFGPYKWARQFFAKQCEWIRVFSKGTVLRASKELKVSDSKFTIVPEGSYVGYYPDEVSDEDAREKLNINKDLRTFLFLGGIRPYKGIDELIVAFNRIKEKNSLLIIAGMCRDEKYKKTITEKIKGNSQIRFVPELISNDELQNYYKSSDIVVLPFNKVENSGSVILAMGFKKMVIAPYMGVLVERLSCQKKFLFQLDGLDKKMEQAAKETSPEEIRQIGNCNFEQLQKYQWKDYAILFK